MTIHHTQRKQAIRMGCHLSIIDSQKYRIFWPERAVELFNSDPATLISEMAAVQEILKNSKYRVITNGSVLIRLINADSNKEMRGCPDFPSVILSLLVDKVSKWGPIEEPPKQEESKPTRVNGIAISGDTAYQEGVPAADCPFMEEDPEFARWNKEWDEAADRQLSKETRAPGKGSVITSRYRANYAEMGHPTHCGDELAVELNKWCANKSGTNMAIFDEICELNGVDLSKYSRTTKGWQGRLRMTGRNLLVKKVREAKGKLILPEWTGTGYAQMSQDWLETAESKYKPKSW